MGLKVLLKIDDQVQFRNVQILEEDELIYTIFAKGLNMTFVRKDWLYKNVYGSVFGFDRDKMIEAWNEEVERQVGFKEVELRRLKNSIIPKGFEGNIHKIEDYRKEN